MVGLLVGSIVILVLCAVWRSRKATDRWVREQEPIRAARRAEALAKATSLKGIRDRINDLEVLIPVVRWASMLLVIVMFLLCIFASPILFVASIVIFKAGQDKVRHWKAEHDLLR